MDGLNLKIGDSTMEIIKLRELADIQTGPFGSQLHKEDYVQVGTPIVTVEHLGKRVFTEQNLPHVDNKDKIRLKKYSLLEGDIVFSRVGAIDRSSYVDKEHEGWLFSGRCLRIRPYRKVYPLYLYYYLQLERVKSFIRSIAVGATMPSINTSILGKVNILVPEIAVQKNIAKQMAILDDKIELSNDLNRKLQQFRQAMLTKLFPREGAVEPELRFRGFSGQWVAESFEHLASRVSTMDNNSALPRVEYEDIISGTGMLNKDIYKKSSLKAGIEFSAGDVLYGKLRPYLKNWLFATFSGIAVGDFWVLHPGKIAGKFLYYLIQSIGYQNLANMTTGTKMPRADWAVISKAKFMVPNDLAEQEYIGNFIYQVDAYISLQQKKLERMQRLKAALLEKMFV